MSVDKLTRAMPCPHPEVYDRGDCCGVCPEPARAVPGGFGTDEEQAFGREPAQAVPSTDQALGIECEHGYDSGLLPECPMCVNGECTAGPGCYDCAEQDAGILAEEAAALASGEPARAVPEEVLDAAVSKLYRQFKEWSKRGFGPEDVTWCEVRAEIAALIAAPLPPARAVPEEWVTVPREPTEDMLEAGWGRATAARCYKAMLSAAPVPAPEGKPVTPVPSSESIFGKHRDCDCDSWKGTRPHRCQCPKDSGDVEGLASAVWNPRTRTACFDASLIERVATTLRTLFRENATLKAERDEARANALRLAREVTQRDEDGSALEARVEALTKALEPFAEVLKGNYWSQPDDMLIHAGAHARDLRLVLHLVDFRAAARALSEQTPKT